MEELRAKYSSIMADSLATSSKTQYERCWKIFVEFCQHHGLDPLGCGVDGVLGYLAYVNENFSNSVSTGYTHLSSIAHHYKANGVTGITDDPRVAMYMKGLKRRNQGATVTRAEPMTVEILTALRTMLYKKPTLITWRTTWRAFMEYCLMLRWDDVSRLTATDLKFESGPQGAFMRVTLKGGKTAMMPSHVPQRIVTSNLTKPEMCLVTLTQDYLAFLGEHRGSLQPTCSPGNAMKPHPIKTVGYTLALEDLRKTITKAGFDGAKYGEHSGKRGGASRAAASGMTEDEIRDFGNWTSTSTARKYIQQSTPLRAMKSRRFQYMMD